MQIVQTDFIQGSHVRPQDLPFRTLARHLQLRLRYARLKVDHGWQKQSINEVENLYFHQHHFRNANASTKQAESRPGPVNINQSDTDTQPPSSAAQDISSGISVFDSRQTPNEILILRPLDIEKDQEHRGNVDPIDNTENEVMVADSVSHNSQISQVSSLDEQSPTNSAAVPSRADFAPATPQNSKILETESGDVPTASGNLGSSASGTTSSATEGQGVEEAADRPSEAREDGVTRDATPASSSLRTASIHPVSNPDAPVSSSSNHAPRKQTTTSQGAQATSSSRSSALTYDSFWSSHSSSVVTYGYGPYAPNALPSTRAQKSVIPAKRSAPTDADTAMLELR